MAADKRDQGKALISFEDQEEEIIYELKSRLWYIDLYNKLSSFIESHNLISDIFTKDIKEKIAGMDNKKDRVAYYAMLKEQFVRGNIQKIINFDELTTDVRKFMGRVVELILKEIFDEYVDEKL